MTCPHTTIHRAEKGLEPSWRCYVCGQMFIPSELYPTGTGGEVTAEVGPGDRITFTREAPEGGECAACGQSNCWKVGGFGFPCLKDVPEDQKAPEDTSKDAAIKAINLSTDGLYKLVERLGKGCS